MSAHSHINPEDQLYDVLGVIFGLETPVALYLSKQAACQIATFYADVGATEGSAEAVEVALDRIHELQIELLALERHLADFKNSARLRMH